MIKKKRIKYFITSCGKYNISTDAFHFFFYDDTVWFGSEKSKRKERIEFRKL